MHVYSLGDATPAARDEPHTRQADVRDSPFRVLAIRSPIGLSLGFPPCLRATDFAVHRRMAYAAILVALD